MSGSSVQMEEGAGYDHRQAVELTLHSPPSSLAAQIHQLQQLTAQTSSRAAQTSTCVLVPSGCSVLPFPHLCHPPYFLLIPGMPSPVLQNMITVTTPNSQGHHPLLSPEPKCPLAPFQILLFSLALIILPSFSPFQGQPETRPESYQLHGGKRQVHGSPHDEPEISSLQNS